MFNLTTAGYCPVCQRDTVFTSSHEWLRDNFVCSNCRSIPRERALLRALALIRPDWRNLCLHESSPSKREISRRFAECAKYIPSQYWPDVPPGQSRDGIRCENLEALTFPGESIDIHITQDVLEHVLNPERAFKEIARTLRGGGMHICTVPLVKKFAASTPRARVNNNGEIEKFLPEAYHGNPISKKGSLVTTDWGYDIAELIAKTSGLQVTRLVFNDLRMGLRAEYMDVLVCSKEAKL